jgi:hypothetical protein
MKILGINCDRFHTMTQIKESGYKGCKRVLIVKAVMGPKWGFSMEDGILTYKALVAPDLGYGAPIILPVRSSLKHPVVPLHAFEP